MTSDIQSQLFQDIPKQYVSERKGLSYVTGRYVKQRLNEIFGWDGWGYEIQESKLLHLDEEAVRWYVHLRLRVGEVTRDGIALGHGTLKDRYGKPLSPGRMNEVIDFAAAEAVTDALKRAAMSLGQNLGLSLYPLTSDASGQKTFEDPVATAAKDHVVEGFSRRIGQASDMGELLQVAGEIARSNLSEGKTAILRTLYDAQKKKLGGT